MASQLKATGVVRRIDDLGRVVIPKEIRRVLKIRDGAPMEIYTDKEGGVILKKYSPMGELSVFASQYVDSLHKTCGHIVCIADRDTIIAVSGAAKKEFVEKNVSAALEKIIESKIPFVVKNHDDRIQILADEAPEKNYFAQTIAAIVSEGDPIGAVIMLSTDPNSKMGEVEAKLTQSAAGFLGKQMEQ